jgi:hypothetical protein
MSPKMSPPGLLSLLLLLASAAAHPATEPSPASAASTRTFDVTSFGAVGDGAADDTAAFQAAFDALGTAPGTVRVPTGSFLLTSTVRIACPGLFSFRGDGPGSNLLWASDSTLLLFDAPAPVGMATIADLTVSSVMRAKSAASVALAFPAGLVKSLIDTVQVIGAGGLPSGGTGGVPQQTFIFGGGFDLGNVTDTVSLRNCLLWFGCGTGVKIGRGSEVRLEGGRYIGNKNDGGPDDSIGVHVTGNNGGVHVVSSDIISWGTGMALDSSNGQGSNREIFISHGTLDSNGRGLAVFDNSYVSIAGCWAASSALDNIWTAPGSNPQLDIAGGTIFNAGATAGGDCANSQCNGITVNGGTFVLSGVAIRNNQGTGIWTPSDKVTGYVISGCRVTDNGFGARLAGQDFTVTGSVFRGNKNGSLALTSPSLTHVVSANIGADSSIAYK